MYFKYLLSISLVLIVACQRQTHLDSMPLATYGHDNLVNETIITRLLSAEGTLTLKYGCVGLDYSEQTGQFKVIPILPGGTKLIQQGAVLQMGELTFRNGDYVLLTGSPTIRHFETRLKNMPFSPVPEHCHAQTYFSTGSIRHIQPKSKSSY